MHTIITIHGRKPVVKNPIGSPLSAGTVKTVQDLEQLFSNKMTYIVREEIVTDNKCRFSYSVVIGNRICKLNDKLNEELCSCIDSRYEDAGEVAKLFPVHTKRWRHCNWIVMKTEEFKKYTMEEMLKIINADNPKDNPRLLELFDGTTGTSFSISDMDISGVLDCHIDFSCVRRQNDELIDELKKYNEG